MDEIQGDINFNGKQITFKSYFTKSPNWIVCVYIYIYMYKKIINLYIKWDLCVFLNVLSNKFNKLLSYHISPKLKLIKNII